MTIEQAINFLAQNGRLPDLGQLRPETKKYLEAQVKRKILHKEKRHWPPPPLSTCKKTYYVVN